MRIMRKSKNKYTEDWPEIAEKAKKETGYKCVRCGHEHDPKEGYVLTVHHLDMNPQNNEWWNIPPLCQRWNRNIF